jgi:hypothetical protein
MLLRKYFRVQVPVFFWLGWLGWIKIMLTGERNFLFNLFRTYWLADNFQRLI